MYGRHTFHFVMHLKIRSSNVSSALGCDDVEAIKQAIYNILNTERYQYIIFSWDYGVELKDLFGKPIDYVMPEVERRITEALVQDDRIDSCDSFEFEKKGRKLLVTFVAHTKFGSVPAQKEVDV